MRLSFWIISDDHTGDFGTITLSKNGLICKGYNTKATKRLQEIIQERLQPGMSDEALLQYMGRIYSRSTYFGAQLQHWQNDHWLPIDDIEGSE